jgi:hypothetical protein
MVLPDPDEIDTYLVGKYALGDEVTKRLRVADRMTVRVRHDIAEGVEPELERHDVPSP